MTAGDESTRRSLIDRLLEEPDETPPEAVTRASATPESGPAEDPNASPKGATFLVHDEWDTQRGPRQAIEDAGTTASQSARRWLATGDPAARHIARLVIFALAVVGAAAGLVVAWFHITNDPLADAHAYYNAAVRLNAGQPLYPPGQDVNSALVYYYPPLLAIVLRPFALLPWEAFAALWELAVVGSFALLLRHLGLRERRTWLAVALLGIPIGWVLAIGQVQMPMVLLLAIGQPWSVALAANIKLFPLLVVLFWIGRRDWQATIAFVLYLVLIGLVQLVLEPAGTLTFLRTVGLADVGQVRNLSPYAASPVLWLVLLVVGIGATIVLARTRWGWAAAVTLATLAPPRLLLYALTGLLAAVREPRQANLPEADGRPWQRVSGSGRH